MGLPKWRNATHFFMRREDGKASSGGLMLFRSTQSPECDRSTTKLSEPALKFRLRGVVRKAGHMKDLASLRKESSDIGSSIHRSGQDIRMILGRL